MIVKWGDDLNRRIRKSIPETFRLFNASQ